MAATLLLRLLSCARGDTLEAVQAASGRGWGGAISVPGEQRGAPRLPEPSGVTPAQLAREGPERHLNRRLNRHHGTSARASQTGFRNPGS